MSPALQKPQQAFRNPNLEKSRPLSQLQSLHWSKKNRPSGDLKPCEGVCPELKNRFEATLPQLRYARASCLLQPRFNTRNTRQSPAGAPLGAPSWEGKAPETALLWPLAVASPLAEAAQEWQRGWTRQPSPSGRRPPSSSLASGTLCRLHWGTALCDLRCDVHPLPIAERPGRGHHLGGKTVISAGHGTFIWDLQASPELQHFHNFFVSQ